jgi:excisionase family DNA binding protein
MANDNPFDRIEHRFEFIQKSIDELKDLISNKTDKPPDEIGGVQLAVKLTGLSAHSIYRLVCERKIPHSKRGNRLYFSRKHLQQWLEAGSRAIKK